MRNQRATGDQQDRPEGSSALPGNSPAGSGPADPGRPPADLEDTLVGLGGPLFPHDDDPARPGADDPPAGAARPRPDDAPSGGPARSRADDAPSAASARSRGDDSPYGASAWSRADDAPREPHSGVGGGASEEAEPPSGTRSPAAEAGEPRRAGPPEDDLVPFAAGDPREDELSDDTLVDLFTVADEPTVDGLPAGAGQTWRAGGEPGPASGGRATGSGRPGDPLLDPGLPAAEAALPLESGALPGEPLLEPGLPGAAPGVPLLEGGPSGVEPGVPLLEGGLPPVEPGVPLLADGLPPVEAGAPLLASGTLPGEAGEPLREPGLPAGEPGEPSVGPGGVPLAPGGTPPGPGGQPPGAGGGAAAPGGTPAAPSGPPRAARSTTIVLIVALFVGILVTGVLGTIAVLMTRQPDLPLGAPPPKRLATPIHFAPVTGVKAAPCPGAEAVLDDAGTTCYQLDPGVTVTSVIKVETVAEKDGTYDVRVVLAPDSRQRLADLIRDSVDQQLAIVVADRVVTAPRVAQPITQDSLSITGLSKEAAEGLFARLMGTTGTVTGVPNTGTTAPASSPTSQSTCPPNTSATGGPIINPPTGNAGTGNPGTGTGNSGTGTGNPGTGTGNPGSGNPGTGTNSGLPGSASDCPPGSGTSTGGTSTGETSTSGTSTGGPAAPSTGGPAAPTGGPGGSASQPGSMPLQPTGPAHTPGTGGAGTAPAGGEVPSSTTRTSAVGGKVRSPAPAGDASSKRVRKPDPRFPTCKRANAAGYGPYTKGVHEEYSWYPDRDHDGVACERDEAG